MPLLLLKVRKAVWQRTSLPSFLAEGDIPADCLADLNLQGNTLSVWHVEDDRSNLNRVVTALASACDFVSNVDYLVFNSTVVTGLGLKVRQTAGGTRDSVANRSWHCDLVELSGRKVLDLAVAIFYNSDVQRVPKKTILDWLKRAVADSEVDHSKLTPRISAEVASGPIPPFPRFVRLSRRVGKSVKEAWQDFWRG